MARLELNGLKEFDNFTKGLSDLALDIDEIAKDCIDAATPTLVESMQNNINAAVKRGYSTGELARSITPTKAKTNAYGNFAAVRPVGTDEKGTRNGEKLAYLEYGPSKQDAHPVIAKAIAQAEPQVEEIIQKRFNEYVDKKIK